MDSFCKYFLTGAALTGNQNGGPRRRNLSDKIEHRLHLFAFADDVGEIIALL